MVFQIPKPTDINIRVSILAKRSRTKRKHHYPTLRESRLIYFPRGTEMFHFPRLSLTGLCVQPAVTPHYQRWVSPFGNPRVKGCSTPHRGLSQSSTPFIDSRCQGIHHVPLLS